MFVVLTSIIWIFSGIDYSQKISVVLTKQCPTEKLSYNSTKVTGYYKSSWFMRNSRWVNNPKLRCLPINIVPTH